mmetsp:Transcript_20353/g.42446  ORF Transcript_20353/g.42446 Transcript_20353/m.42446 type:complete len:292 (-) Transcript_20353:225-1100(-)
MLALMTQLCASGFFTPAAPSCQLLVNELTLTLASAWPLWRASRESTKEPERRFTACATDQLWALLVAAPSLRRWVRDAARGSTTELSTQRSTQTRRPEDGEEEPGGTAMWQGEEVKGKVKTLHSLELERGRGTGSVTLHPGALKGVTSLGGISLADSSAPSGFAQWLAPGPVSFAGAEAAAAPEVLMTQRPRGKSEPAMAEPRAPALLPAPLAILSSHVTSARPFGMQTVVLNTARRLSASAAAPEGGFSALCTGTDSRVTLESGPARTVRRISSLAAEPAVWLRALKARL